MPGSSILPVALHNNKLYFLFGKENSMEKSAPGFSDFGGGIEKGETPFETAVREGGEELTGFLGSSSQIRRHIKKNGGTYAFTHTNAKNSAQNYTVHIIKHTYDPYLPIHYNNNHRFLWNRMNHKLLSSTKLFEKIEIEWFCEDDLKKRMSEYRPFYREVVDTLLRKLDQIRAFVKSGAASSPAKTKRRRFRKNGRRGTAKKMQRGG
jgi:8-oxo-dGTP pyrophosphatase MutT (NUDIX family)